ncbi:MAG: class I SAM-dependent methyltransferase [Phycisphaerales bacterium]|nr:class I SAM-dependent methyltransferase [Phycisphaerales bacterium]
MSPTRNDRSRIPAGSLQRPIVGDNGTGGLELRWDGDRPGSGVRLDPGWLARQFRGGRLPRRQPLAKAIGTGVASIVDATGGLGEDSLLLACLGWSVTVFERSAALAALLDDGVNRLRQGGDAIAAAAARISVIEGDARLLLPSMERRPDVVYLDPMFPPKRRSSALPPKAMQLLRALVGDDPDAAEMLALARTVATRRVVVKRPDHAAPLAEGAIAEHGGKLVRYDVYAPVPPPGGQVDARPTLRERGRET